jgi:hypothetical protein
VTELEVTPATTSPGTNRGKGKAKGSHGKTHRRASVHGRVSYRLSRRAPVRLELRGPRIRRRSGFAITIEHPKLHGRVRLSRLTAGRSLPRGRYRIAAAAIDAGGGVSSLRRARFRVVPRHSRSARAQRS